MESSGECRGVAVHTDKKGVDSGVKRGRNGTGLHRAFRLFLLKDNCELMNYCDVL